MTYPDIQGTTTVELAFGADVTTDQATWDWTDVTADQDLLAQAIPISHGRDDEQSQVQASDCTVILDNRHGRYTPDHPMSIYYPNVVEGTPIRVTVNGSIRFVGQVQSWEPTWPHGDLSDIDDLVDLEDDDNQLRGESFVTVRAAGVLQRLATGQTPLRSPIRRFYDAFEAANPGVIVAYLPFEDASGTLFPLNVPGGATNRYNSPAPTYAGDETLLGSLATPEWPLATTPVTVGNAFGVLPHRGTWSVHVLARLPAGTGECRLVEWRTNGTRTDWTLGTNSSGQVVVTCSDETSTNTYTFLGSDVDDGDWHRLSVHVLQETGPTQQVVWTVVDGGGIADLNTTSGLLVGRVLRVRPRPTFTSTAGKSPIGLAHCVVMGGQEGPNVSTPAYASFFTQPPIDGFAGELATNRCVRLGDEEGVPCRIGGSETVVEDTFTRSVSNGWGSPDTGSAWTLTGTAANFDVDGSVGTIVGTSGGQFATTGDYEDVEISVRTMTDTLDRENSLVARWTDSSNYYSFAIDLDSGAESIDIFRIAAGVTTNIGSVTIPEEMLGEDLWYQMRAQALGSYLNLRVWREDLGEGTAVEVTATDTTHAGGAVGVAAFAAASSVKSFDDFSVMTIPRSTRLGPQPVGTLLQLWQGAADADGGILHETRDELGMTFRPRASIYNRAASLTLDAAADNQGDITHPFAPVLDDDGQVNDLTLERLGGSSVQIVDITHVASRGRREQKLTLNLESDLQLPDHAMWRLRIGTWPGMRYPSIVPALNARPGLADDWIGLQLGDRVDVTNLPPQHPPGDVSLVMQGYSERIRPNTWDVEINASPFNPYVVGERVDTSDTPGPADPVRRDTAGSEVEAGLVLPSGSGNYASTPDTGVLDVTGNLEIRVEATLADWNTGANQTLVGKYVTTGNQRSYQLFITTTGLLRLIWSTDGTSGGGGGQSSSVAPTVANHERLAVRAALDVDDGAGGHDVTFYTAESIDGPWTQLGSVQTGAGTTSIHSGTAPLWVGTNAGLTEPAVGTIHAVQVWNGFEGSGGSQVANPDFDAQGAGTTSFADAAGRTWSLNGSAALAGDFLAGTDTTLYVRTTQGPLWAVSGAANLDLPLDLAVAGARLRASAIGAAVGQVQAFTISSTVVNGVTKTIPAGEAVRLWAPAVRAL